LAELGEASLVDLYDDGGLDRLFAAGGPQQDVVDLEIEDLQESGPVDVANGHEKGNRQAAGQEQKRAAAEQGNAGVVFSDRSQKSLLNSLCAERGGLPGRPGWMGTGRVM
jgi:hypothetical protein